MSMTYKTSNYQTAYSLDEYDRACFKFFNQIPDKVRTLNYKTTYNKKLSVVDDNYLEYFRSSVFKALGVL